MVHFRAFVKEYGVQELTKPLFRILVLQLSSPSAATNDENIVDMVGGAIKPRSKPSNARRLQVLAQYVSPSCEWGGCGVCSCRSGVQNKWPGFSCGICCE